MMAKYAIGFTCPLCYEQVSFIADDLYSDFLPREDSYRSYLAPTHLVMYPCRHRLKELGITKWGGIWFKFLYPNKIENPTTTEDEGFNAFVEGKQEADNPHFPYRGGDYWKCNEWYQGWYRAREIAKQL